MTNNVATSSKTPKLCWLKVEDVRIPEGRLRSRFDDQDDFNESVRANGVIQPIHVCEDKSGVYWLADGQNRLEAAKSQGKPVIQAYVVKGSKQDAILHSAKLNVLRGKVNVGELAEFLLNLRKDMKVEEIAESLRLSKGYVSKLLSIAENKPVLEKLKAGIISYKEAYNEVLSKFSEETESFPGKQESQETIHEAKSLTVKQETKEARQPLTDEDLGLALVDCLLLSPPKESRTLDALIFEVEYQGKRYRLGVIGKAALESVKKHGYRDNSSRIHLKVPQSLLKEPIGWINEAY